MLLPKHHGSLDIKFQKLISHENEADNQQRFTESRIKCQFQKSIKRTAVFNYRTVSFLLQCFAWYVVRPITFL